MVGSAEKSFRRTRAGDVLHEEQRLGGDGFWHQDRELRRQRAFERLGLLIVTEP
jgi:hypothetical protein